MEIYEISYDDYIKAIDDNANLKEQLIKLTQKKHLNKRNEEIYNELTEKINKVKKEYTLNSFKIDYYEKHIKEKGEDENDKYKRK